MNQYEIEIQQLKTQVCELQEQLKKYTAPTRSKKFYQNHKEELKQKAREYKEKMNYSIPKDKKKEYNKRAYEKRKEKMKTVDIQNENPKTETI